MYKNTTGASLAGSLNPEESREMAQAMLSRVAGREDEWDQAPLDRLVRRLLRDHHRWLHVDLPTIEYLLDRLRDDYRSCATPVFMAPLRQAFSRLRHQIERHAANEENVLFPAIVELEQSVANGLPPARPAFGSLRHPISMMQHDLQAQLHLFGEIRDILQGYALPDDGPKAVGELFKELQMLELTFRAHVRLASEVLFPRAKRLEAESRS
jgi:regulator of cell morphogenesis and NO signaling